MRAWDDILVDSDYVVMRGQGLSMCKETDSAGVASIFGVHDRMSKVSSCEIVGIVRPSTKLMSYRCISQAVTSMSKVEAGYSKGTSARTICRLIIDSEQICGYCAITLHA